VIFSTPFCIRRPRYGGPRRNTAIPFGMRKLEWWGYPTVNKYEDMCNRLDSIPAFDRRTDGRTDRQTNTLRRHSPRYAYASRCNNAEPTIRGGGENAGPENAGLENQDHKMEDQRSERTFCGGNMRDCVVEKNAVVKQSLSTQCNTMSNTLKPTITLR